MSIEIIAHIVQYTIRPDFGEAHQHHEFQDREPKQVAYAPASFVIVLIPTGFWICFKRSVDVWN